MKERLAAAADHAGKSAHAFILDAITQTVELVELDRELNEVADQRWQRILASGKTVSWEDANLSLGGLPEATSRYTETWHPSIWSLCRACEANANQGTK